MLIEIFSVEPKKGVSIMYDRESLLALAADLLNKDFADEAEWECAAEEYNKICNETRRVFPCFIDGNTQHEHAVNPETLEPILLIHFEISVTTPRPENEYLGTYKGTSRIYASALTDEDQAFLIRNKLKPWM